MSTAHIIKRYTNVVFTLLSVAYPEFHSPGINLTEFQPVTVYDITKKNVITGIGYTKSRPHDRTDQTTAQNAVVRLTAMGCACGRVEVHWAGTTHNADRPTAYIILYF